MQKSHFNPDPNVRYCVEHSYKLHPIQRKLIEVSLCFIFLMQCGNFFKLGVANDFSRVHVKD